MYDDWARCVPHMETDLYPVSKPWHHVIQPSRMRHTLGYRRSPLKWAVIRTGVHEAQLALGNCEAAEYSAAELSAQFNEAVCEKLSALYLSMGRFDDWGRLHIRRLEEDSSLSENAVLAMDTMERRRSALCQDGIRTPCDSRARSLRCVERLESLSKQLGMGRQAAQALEHSTQVDRRRSSRYPQGLRGSYLTELRDFEKAKSHFQELVVIQPGMSTHLKVVDALVRNGGHRLPCYFRRSA